MLKFLNTCNKIIKSFLRPPPVWKNMEERIKFFFFSFFFNTSFFVLLKSIISVPKFLTLPQGLYSHKDTISNSLAIGRVPCISHILVKIWKPQLMLKSLSHVYRSLLFLLCSSRKVNHKLWSTLCAIVFWVTTDHPLRWCFMNWKRGEVALSIVKN